MDDFQKFNRDFSFQRPTVYGKIFMTLWSSYHLVRHTKTGAWQRPAFSRSSLKCDWDFLISKSISGKNFHEDPISNYYIITQVIIPLGAGGSLHSTYDFQKLMVCSLYNPRSLPKISSKSTCNFLSNPVRTHTHTHTHTHQCQWKHNLAKLRLMSVMIECISKKPNYLT